MATGNTASERTGTGVDAPGPIGTDTAKLYLSDTICGNVNEPSCPITEPMGYVPKCHQVGIAVMRQPAAGFPSEQSATPFTSLPLFRTIFCSVIASGSSLSVKFDGNRRIHNHRHMVATNLSQVDSVKAAEGRQPLLSSVEMCRYPHLHRDNRTRKQYERVPFLTGWSSSFTT